jgi:hypothetical protein
MSQRRDINIDIDALNKLSAESMEIVSATGLDRLSAFTVACQRHPELARAAGRGNELAKPAPLVPAKSVSKPVEPADNIDDDPDDDDDPPSKPAVKSPADPCDDDDDDCASEPATKPTKCDCDCDDEQNCTCDKSDCDEEIEDDRDA